MAAKTASIEVGGGCGGGVDGGGGCAYTNEIYRFERHTNKADRIHRKKASPILPQRRINRQISYILSKADRQTDGRTGGRTDIQPD